MDQVKPVSVPETPNVDFEAVCQRVRAALDSARIYAVSLLDEKGDVLWMTEGSMGPDEHNAVVDAYEIFAKSKAPPAVDYDLGDSRSAVLFRIVNNRRAMAGAVMVITDTRTIKQHENGATRLLTSKLQRVLSEFATTRAHVPPMPAGRNAAPVAQATRPAEVTGPSSILKQESGIRELTLADDPPPSAFNPLDDIPLFDADPAPPVPPVLTQAVASPTPARVRHSDDPSPKAPAAAGAPDIERLQAALRRSPIALHVQRLMPLNKGTQLRRYEVLLRSSSEDAPNVAPQAMLKAAVENGLGSMIDRRVITQLISWLIQHPDAWQSQPVMFSVNLTNTALHDEHFIKFLDLCLSKASLPRAMVAFEFDVSTALRFGGRVLEIATSLERLGCPIVLDDFGLRTDCFELLRLPSVRYIKLEPAITAKMRSDKVSQAAITGVVQIARVMGMHTVAKRTETAAEQEWLTALGVDFIQSHALSPPVTIESLSKAPVKTEARL